MRSETARSADEHPIETALSISLFGPFTIAIDGRIIPETSWRGQKARTLIKLLAIAPGCRLPRDVVLDHLWPDYDAATAQPNLYNTLSIARHALAPATIRLREGILTLHPDGPVRTDVARFEDAAAVARSTSDSNAYTSAIALYGGDLLPDDPYVDWAIARRENLRENYRGLLRVLARLMIDAAPDVALDAFDRLVTLDPTDENATAGLMRLHMRAGDRAAALRRYGILRDAIERDLDAEPGAELRKLYGDIATEQFAIGPPTSPGTTPSVADRSPQAPLASPALPIPLTRLVGRDREIEAVRVAIREDAMRLITITGVGGIGKTRLALAVAQALRAEYAGALWFVELDRLTDPALLADTIAATLEVQVKATERPISALVRGLRERSALIILDNCEHLIDAVAELTAVLLTGCPQLTIVATSREAIRLPSERAYPLGPLALPTMPSDQTLSSVAATPAVALFVERVRHRQPQFTLTEENIRAVIAICQRLDGLPLALELAAARTGILTIGEIAARLDNMLETLATRERSVPTRQRTLRAALDWSYALLTPPEQTLLRQLASFVGSFDLTAIEATLAGPDLPGQSLDAVEGLADKSLITVLTTTEGTRYRLLEPVRQYAMSRLGAEEGVALAARHAAHYLALAEAGEVGLASPRQVAWQRRLVIEEDNLRSAFQWALNTGAPTHGLRLASALVPHWMTRGAYREGLAQLAALFALADDRGEQVAPTLRAKAFAGAGMLCWRQSDHQRAHDYADLALAIYRKLGDIVGAAKMLRLLANTELGRNEPQTAVLHLQEAEQLLRRGEHRRDLALILNTLGEVSRSILHNYEQAERQYREALAIERADGSQERLAIYTGNLAAVLLYRGNTAGSLHNYRESLALCHELAHQRGIAIGLEGIGSVAIVNGEPLLAAQLYGAASTIRMAIGAPRDSDPADEAEHQRYLNSARFVAAPEEWAAHWRHGQALALDETIAVTHDVHTD